jgi:hypothetical protein
MSSSAQPPVTFSLADSLYAAGSYWGAITEYKRLIFLNSKDTVAPLAWERIGLCHRELGELDLSVRALQISIDITDQIVIKDDRRISLAVSHLAAGEMSAARIILAKIHAFSQDCHVKSRATFWLALCAALDADWNGLREHLGSEEFPGDSVAKEGAMSLLESMLAKDLKNPQKARILSYVIPGLGQLYGGHPLAAVHALAVNCVTGYVFYSTITSTFGALEVLSSLFLLHRYWSGSADRAATLIEADLGKRDQLVRMRILEHMMDAYEGMTEAHDSEASAMGRDDQ